MQLPVDIQPTYSQHAEGYEHWEAHNLLHEFHNKVATAFSNTHFPEAYGAIGDGVTDDTAALSAAFAAAANGQVVLRPGANYRVTGFTVASTSIVVIGYGATISFDANLMQAISFSNCSSVRILGVIFDGNGEAGDNHRIAMRFINGTRNVQIVGCTFNRCVGNCILFSSTETQNALDYTIRDCQFLNTITNHEDLLSSIDVRYIVGGGRIRHINNTHLPDASNPSSVGIGVASDEGFYWVDVLIDGNIMEGHQWRGISLTDEHATSDFDTGIAIVTNNVIKHTDRSAMKIKQISRVVVRGNYLEDNDNVEESTSLRGAINIHSGSHYEIEGNMIFNGKAEGIVVEGATTANGADSSGTRRASRLIANNIIENCVRYAILMAQRNYDVVITGNVSRNCRGHISLQGQNASVEDHVRNVSISGGASYNQTHRHIDAVYSDGVSVNGGNYLACGEIGMVFSNCTDVAIVGAILAEAGTLADGIVFSTCAIGLINGCILRSIDRYGVRTSGTISDISVIGTTFASIGNSPVNGTITLIRSNIGVADN